MDHVVCVLEVLDSVKVKWIDHINVLRYFWYKPIASARQLFSQSQTTLRFMNFTFFTTNRYGNRLIWQRSKEKYIKKKRIVWKKRREKNWSCLMLREVERVRGYDSWLMGDRYDYTTPHRSKTSKCWRLGFDGEKMCMDSKCTGWEWWGDTREGDGGMNLDELKGQTI